MHIEVLRQGDLVSKALDFRANIMHDTFGIDISQDKDMYDDNAYHIIAVESDTVVGYYRAIVDSSMGFYTESEFDLTALDLDRNKVLEIGRAAASGSNPSVMLGLWKSILDLAKSLEKQYVLGAASIKPSETNVLMLRDKWRSTHGYLLGKHAIPKCPYIKDDIIDTINYPKLIQIYEKIGAKIVSDPGYDPVFDTADVVTVLDLNHVNNRWIERLAFF